MKTFIYRLTLLAASVMLFSIPARSEEGFVAGSDSIGMSVDKNECLLVAKNCTDDSIQERIDKLATEINRGTDVYSTDELKKMQGTLDSYDRLLIYLNKNERSPGAGA
jgi:hypothetical protein